MADPHDLQSAPSSIPVAVLEANRERVERAREDFNRMLRQQREAQANAARFGDDF